MLFDATPVATLPTSDLDRASAFYEQVMGFEPGDNPMPGGVTYPCGSGSIFVYVSDYAGTNEATAVTFDVTVAEFDTSTAALRSAGVVFDTFEFEGVTWQDGIAHMGDYRAVWFRDPDGNIINIMQHPA
jgi:catechol 2,3-dioxygenase-like lactoylglutathione lyase family enzyme